jgi:hypothetical protein
MTSGQHAVGAFNTLTLLICFLLLFFMVDALERERSTGILQIVYSTPHPTSALVLGKNLAMIVLAVLILAASFLAGSFVVALESQLAPQIGPYLIVRGLLMGAAAAKRFPVASDERDLEKTPVYQDARTSITLGSGESREIRVVSDFEPERLVVDPDVEVLMLWRKQSEFTL